MLDGAWAATSALGNLSSARRLLVEAESDLAAGNLDVAIRRFDSAREDSEGAAGLTVHPSAALASIVPGLADEIDAIQALARATAEASRAGGELVGSARAIDWDGRSFPGRSDGGIDLDIFPRVLPGLHRADGFLGRADTALGSVDRSGLSGPVAGAIGEARGVLDARTRLVRHAADLARLLPSFLGGEEPRRYFVAVQNLSAPRGSGGFLGVYGVLRAEDGVLELEELSHTGSLGTVPRVDAPPDVEARYGRFGGTTHFIAANYSPDFPTTARLLLDMWEADGRPPLDGVLGVDSVWLSYILGATGPVETPAWPEPLTAENVSTVLNHDTFLLPEAQSDRAQEELGRALFGSLLDGPLPVRGLGEAMDRSVRERHLQVFAVREEEQAILERLGATGTFRLDERPLAVVWQDATAARAGYFAEKEASHRVVLQADGSALVETEVLLRNTAPEGPPSALLGSGQGGDPVGYYAAYVNVYLPVGADGVEATVDGNPSFGVVEEEFGHPVVMYVMGAPPGQAARLRVSYRIPAPPEGLGELRWRLLPQPALRPDSVEVSTAVEEAGVDLAGEGVAWTGIPTDAAGIVLPVRVIGAEVDSRSPGP
ncbi:MAG: DUF4012 domain-containing protein [Actinomycetota bacterium]